MKKIALIGSTGSIGRQVLNVVERNSDKFEIVSMAAGGNARVFLDQLKEFKPKIATLKTVPEKFKDRLPKTIDFYEGETAFLNAVTEQADIVVIALVGFMGILAVLEAIKKGKTIALANKESLVVGGELVMNLAREKGVTILPIDSEHSAVWQALSFDYNKPFKKIILTASGGAFRDFKYKDLKNVKAKDALKHPNWRMGDKITIDCATLVNKGLEVIEAKWLYSAPFEKIGVIIHRQSVIHSMVEFIDSSVIAQLSYPTMEIPISLALSYPERFYTGIDSLNFASLKELTFEELDKKKYPCFDLVVEAGKKGGAYPAVMSGANEEAVALFLNNKIGYFDIYSAIDGALNAYKGNGADFESLVNADKFAKDFVKNKFGD